MKMNLLILSIAAAAVFGCGKEAKTVAPQSGPQSVGNTAADSRSIVYPFFRITPGATVSVVEQMEGEHHTVTIGEPSEPLHFTCFIADAYGDASLTVRVHDAFLAREILHVVNKFSDLGRDGIQGLSPEWAYIRASFLDAQNGPVLVHLDRLFEDVGLTAIIGMDGSRFYVCEKEVTDQTKVWFRFPSGAAGY